MMVWRHGWEFSAKLFEIMQCDVDFIARSEPSELPK
jgi:hypothetical protein